ncbi:hypothetical protein Cpir12675_004687 [Ceratocystis pirilliformis]|uniref:Uncharacterized protein n=1 Tax=Ceratocystis pirilliformis TaxID=259994 RepID=A0ABR3YW71_9PEZI
MSASQADSASPKSSPPSHHCSSTPTTPTPTTATTTTTTVTTPGAATPKPALRPRGKRPESRADSLGSLVIGDSASDQGRHGSSGISIETSSLYHETPEQVRERELRTKTLGYFLAKVALTLDDGIKIFHFADKRNWGPDEFEQLRALERCLDEARRDFQELPTLLDGTSYYTNDRTRASLAEIAILHDRLEDHIEVFRMWIRHGGPINPMWINDTRVIQQDLHNSQCRAARRIFDTKHESTSRCLGAFLVYRQQRAWVGRQDPHDPAYRRHCLNEIAACNTVGRFERFGDCDIAFVCNFCDGYVVWDDLESMPSTLKANDMAVATAVHQGGNSGTDSDSELPQRIHDESNSSRTSNASPPPPSHTGSQGSHSHDNDTNHGYTYTTHGYSYNPQSTSKTPSSKPTNSPDSNTPLELPYPEWQSTGFSATEHQQKNIVFAPVAIASHAPPIGMEWRASHLCRFCDETFDSEQKIAQGNDDIEPFATEEGPGFESVKSFEEHLLWNHTPYTMEMPAVGLPRLTESCAVM